MKKNQKGFTLAELLIVIAIIAVMVAVLIPQYVNTLEKARESADLSGIRAAYSEVVNHYVLDHEVITRTVKVQQRMEDWQTDPAPNLDFLGSGFASYAIPAKTEGEYVVTIVIDDATGDISSLSIS